MPKPRTPRPPSPVFQRGQWSLVGLLVSLVIIAILSAWYYTRILKPQAGSHNGAPAAEQQAYGAACSEYQAQLTQAVTMYKADNNERSPRSFEDLKKYGASDDIVRAPGCQFQLDPSSGTVTEIGHGRAARNAPPIVLGATPPAAAPPAPGGPLVLTRPPAPGPAPAPNGPAGGTDDGQ